MVHDVDPRIQEGMADFEAIDRRDRTDGTPLLSRVRRIPPATGQLP